MSKLPSINFTADPKRIADIDAQRDRAKIAIVKALVAPKKKIDSQATLADLFMDPKRVIDYISRERKDTFAKVRNKIAQARLHVLDDEATILAAELAHASVESMARILKLAIPKSRYSWFELPSNTLMGIRYKQKTLETAIHREEKARMGILVEWREDEQYFSCQCIEHDANDIGNVFVWPIGFRISVDGPVVLGPDSANLIYDLDSRRAHVPDEPATSPAMMTPSEAAFLWGYDQERHDLTPLLGKACAEIVEEYIPKISSPILVNALTQMQGFTRLTCAVLAMLNAVPTIEVTSRPKGHRLIGGKSRPYVERTTISLNIPKRVRMRRAFAEREITKAIKRKKHHHVEPHFRHLEHKPKADGWEACITPWGTPGYRKRIRDHWRGDKELGEVKPKTIVVHGPRFA